MSIIADALRKAEEERVVKEKKATEKQIISEVNFEEEELLKRFGYGTQAKDQTFHSVRVERPNVFFSYLQKVLIAIALVFLCFLVVYLVPRSLLLAERLSANFFTNESVSEPVPVAEEIVPAVSPVEEIAPVPVVPVPVPVTIQEITEEIVAPAPIEPVVVSPVAEIPVEEEREIFEAPQTPFTLTGISNIEGERYALINNSILQVGARIEDAQVKEILDQEVVLETSSGELRLKLSS